MAAIILLACHACPADAGWQRASSPHFVIYANQNPDSLRTFAQRLEHFDQAVRLVRAMPDPSIGDGNRVTLFVVPTVDDVSRLAKKSSAVGFYYGRASGSIAVIPSFTGEYRPGEMTPEVIFFHEYAHHLMFSDNVRPYPEWVVEGFAEFMSTARIDKDGSIGIGIPPQFRANGLFSGGVMPMEKILAGNNDKISDQEREASIYGRSWLLTHCLNFDPSRSGQLSRYLDLIASGSEPLPAARQAFGDLKKLDKDLDAYLAKSHVEFLKIGPTRFHNAAISVDPLSAGAAAVMRDRIQSKIGITEDTAEPLAVRVRAIERRFPGDVLVERTLAEAEFDSKHPDAAKDAADRALKSDARDTEAMIFKGKALAALGNHAEARRWFKIANKADPEDPEPLMLFYAESVAEGIAPTPNAVSALHYASVLAPQDGGLRMTSAVQFLRDGQKSDARHALVPLAFDPHGGAMGKEARALIERIDAGDDPRKLAISLPRPPAASP